MLSPALLCVLLLTGPAQADTLITLGGKVEGSLTGSTDQQVLQFDGLAGELVNVSLRAWKSELRPRVELWDAATDSLLAQADAKKRKAALRSVALPATGRYELRLAALDDSSGRWALKTKSRLDKTLLKPASEAGAGPPGSLRIRFAAHPGMRLSALARPGKGSAALPGAPALTGPEGAIDLTAHTTTQGPRTVVKDAPLGAFGLYTLDVDNVGGAGQLLLTMKLKRRKRSKEILVTDALAGALLVSPDVAYVDDGQTWLTARVALGEGPYPVAAVRLLEVGTGTLVEAALLRDDGELAGNGDEIEGDRVHTAQLAITPLQAGMRTYRAVVDLEGPRVGRSDDVDVLIAHHLTDAEIDAILAIQTDSQALIDQALLDGDLDVVLTELQARLATDPAVAEIGRSEGGNGLWIRYASGIAGVLSSWEPGTKGGVPGDGVQARLARAPAADLPGRLVDYPSYDGFTGRRADPAAAPTADGLLLAAAESSGRPVGSNKVYALAAQHFDWGDDDDIPAMAQELIDDGCYEVTYKKYPSKGSGSVEDFKRLGDYGIVLVSSHGDSFFATLSEPWKAVFGWAGSSSGQVCVHTNATATTANVRTYEDDLRKGRMVLWYGQYGITPSFIRHHTGEMPDSLVYMSICRGTFNATLADAFTSQGAGAFLGYSDYVAVSFCRAHGPPLLTTLLEDDRTLDDAYVYDIEADDDPAEYLLFGSRSLRLDPDRLHDPGFEEGNIAAAWTPSGDARLLTGLAGFGPTDGSTLAMLATGLGFTKSSGSLSQTLCLPGDATGILFDWNFISAEWLWWCGSIFQDTFELELTVVDEPGNSVIAFQRTIDSLCDAVKPASILFDKTPGTPPFEDGKQAGDVYATGWKTSIVDVPPDMAGKRVRLSFRCFDVGDSEWDSAVLLDSLELVTESP